MRGGDGPYCPVRARDRPQTEMRVTFGQLFFSLFDLRSFSSIWYWITLGTLWTALAHWVMGVPIDTVWRARRGDGQAIADMEDGVRITVNRLAPWGGTAGTVALAFGCALLSALAVLGFYGRVELAQALFLMLVPLLPISLMRMALAARIRAEGLSGAALVKRLMRQATALQVMGFVAILVTGSWGTVQNLLSRPF